MNIKKQILLISLVLLILIALVSLFIQKKLQTFQTRKYIKSEKEIKKRLNTLLEDRKKSSLAISIALSRANVVINTLKENNSSTSKSALLSLSKELKDNTNYKNVWIQIINAKGISLLRSWTDFKNDSLINVRADLKELLKDPHPVTTISTGRFTTSFKSTTPVYKNKTLLGFVETITHFNSISKALEHNGYDSLLLVDKKYKKQLTKNITHQFIDDYYIANFQTHQNNLKLIKQIGVKNIVNNKKFMIKNNFFVTQSIIRDIQNKPMAYYVLIIDINSFKHKARDELIALVRNVIFFGVVSIIFLAIIFYKRRIDAQKTYFQNIVDSASEIIIIIHEKQAIDANKAFFEFFYEYKTFKEFHNEIKCICDLFTNEKGYITSKMGDKSWIEYILENPQQDNKVKLIYKNKPYIFKASIKKLPQMQDDTYTLALSDITQMEKYKDKLEHISQTDTLTQIANRSYFTLQIEQEFTRAKRYKSDLSLIMLDIDFFKKINDTFGHDVGDKALIALTNEVQLLLRNSDVFCRYGGEEFMIIMPETSVIEANISAQRIRTHIETLQIPPIEKMTISLGITQLVENDTILSFIKRVDEALYTSKENGRNRATIL